jgi:hypothetical protein
MFFAVLTNNVIDYNSQHFLQKMLKFQRGSTGHLPGNFHEKTLKNEGQPLNHQ